MTDHNQIPTPPHLPGISWRALQATDQGAITALSAACQAADGGQALIADGLYLREEGAGATIGAFEVSGRLIACAAVWPEQTPQEQRTNILGQVHPDQRGRGLGAFLLSWSTAQALLSARLSDRPRVLRLTTEALTPAAERLYQRFGFTQQFAEDVMRRNLQAALPDAPFPPGVTLAEWTPALAGQFFEAYQDALSRTPRLPDLERRAVDRVGHRRRWLSSPDVVAGARRRTAGRLHRVRRRMDRAGRHTSGLARARPGRRAGGRGAAALQGRRRRACDPGRKREQPRRGAGVRLAWLRRSRPAGALCAWSRGLRAEGCAMTTDRRLLFQNRAEE